MLFVYQAFLIIKLWLIKKMTEQQDIVALIPVREGSQRVKGKTSFPKIVLNGLYEHYKTRTFTSRENYMSLNVEIIVTTLKEKVVLITRL